MVRPPLEYCRVSWSPDYHSDVDEIDCVLQNTTELIPSVMDLLLSSFKNSIRASPVQYPSVSANREEIDIDWTNSKIQDISILMPLCSYQY